MASQQQTIIRRWLDLVEDLDLEGLLDLYGPGAIIEAPGGQRYGRDDLEDRLPVLRRFVRKIRLDRTVVRPDGVVTVWNGPHGTCLRFWNRFLADDHRIHRHVIDLLDGDAPVPAAS